MSQEVSHTTPICELPMLADEVVESGEVCYTRHLELSSGGDGCRVEMGNIEIGEGNETHPYKTILDELGRIALEDVPQLATEQALIEIWNLWERIYQREFREKIEVAQGALGSELEKFGINLIIGQEITDFHTVLSDYYQKAQEYKEENDSDGTTLVLEISGNSDESFCDKNSCLAYPYFIVDGELALTVQESVYVNQYGEDPISAIRFIRLGEKGYITKKFLYREPVIPGVRIAGWNNSISSRLRNMWPTDKEIEYTQEGSNSGYHPEDTRPTQIEHIIGCALVQSLKFINSTEWINKANSNLSRWANAEQRDEFWESLESETGKSFQELREAIEELNTVQDLEWRKARKDERNLKRCVARQDARTAIEIVRGQFERTMQPDEQRSFARATRLRELAQRPSMTGCKATCTHCQSGEVITTYDQIEARDRATTIELRTKESTPNYAGDSICNVGVPVERKGDVAFSGCGGRNSIRPFEDTIVTAVVQIERHREN